MTVICPTRLQRCRKLWLCAALLLAFLGGCGQPQVAPANRRLIESLQTAVSAQRKDWLDANARLIDERHESGAVTDVEYEALKSIVDLAQDEKWSEASAKVARLAAGQRVTDEDIARLKAERQGIRP